MFTNWGVIKEGLPAPRFAQAMLAGRPLAPFTLSSRGELRPPLAKKDRRLAISGSPTTPLREKANGSISPIPCERTPGGAVVLLTAAHAWRR